MLNDAFHCICTPKVKQTRFVFSITIYDFDIKLTILLIYKRNNSMCTIYSKKNIF